MAGAGRRAKSTRPDGPTTSSKRGGARPGAGRKPTGEIVAPIYIHLTETERVTLEDALTPGESISAFGRSAVLAEIARRATPTRTNMAGTFPMRFGKL